MVKIVLVAAVSSGQGKTTVTAALARKLVQRGERDTVINPSAYTCDANNKPIALVVAV